MLNYYDLTAEMKRYHRFVVWALYEDKAYVMDPETLHVFDSPNFVETMKYCEAKRHIMKIRKVSPYEINLAFVDDGGNLRLFEI
ncbi:hypothetical protein [Fundidesulfovibrio soli]|uniref:hypothetical protein n=1 Tax=Fundidesulfovibrio soli TaxID=2922716 RepID=UPI001FAFC5F9|nr:hypothetical protein [Fundidesulfovibrio soli]